MYLLAHQHQLFVWNGIYRDILPVTMYQQFRSSLLRRFMHDLYEELSWIVILKPVCNFRYLKYFIHINSLFLYTLRGNKFSRIYMIKKKLHVTHQKLTPRSRPIVWESLVQRINHRHINMIWCIRISANPQKYELNIFYINLYLQKTRKTVLFVLKLSK